MAKKVYWVGKKETCDVCERALGARMYDARTRWGPWACMCHECWRAHGGSLGLGYGQRYERQKDGEWLKTGG